MEETLLGSRKETILEFINDKNYHPMKFKEMCAILCVPRQDRETFKLLLDQLISEGKIMLDGKGRYRAASPEELTGIFCGNAKGFGFVSVEGMDEDIFIGEDDTEDAMHGDTVAVKLVREQMPGKRPEGRVLRVLHRENDTIVGTYEKSRNFGFVVPDNNKLSKDIFISKENSMGAVDGHKVVVQITDFGSSKKNPEGKVIEIIGHINDPGTDILSVVKAYKLSADFPEDVMSEAKGIPESISGADMAGRKDLRHLPTVTIDGEDAKDLDDAITLSRTDDHYVLGVHIADVSHYVKEGSPLDREALKRGTSVYLTDRVIPMLPHRLSNGICSLNAGTDRLALSCTMEIDQKGKILNHEIAETVIRVDRRMSYNGVQKILDGDKELLAEYADYVPLFQDMKKLSDILRKKRSSRGGIDFDFPESKIFLDDAGRAVDVQPYERTPATKIIEDFMLAANETIAEDFFWQEIPFLYRTHETPDDERIHKLTVFIKNFGYYLKNGSGEIHPKEFQKLLGKIEGTPEEALISRLVLRSMMRAKYTTENTGHFGLAVKYYCHFTSPIRRYPDLQIHRIIKETIKGRMDEKRRQHYESLLPQVAQDTSAAERRADEAERDVEKLKKTEYMARHIGEEYEGIISSVTAWGMYVELPNTCEGMVRLQDMLDDYYILDEKQYMLVGETTHRTYSLGQKVKIRVKAADKTIGTVDFLIADDVK